jgi:plasmid stabilization system protein ParE
LSRQALRFTEAAIVEAESAAGWYGERNLQAREDFLQELRKAFELIEEAPERWPKHLHGTRRIVLDRFPFSVIYRVLPEAPQVLAVAHDKRRPGYWRHR